MNVALYTGAWIETRPPAVYQVRDRRFRCRLHHFRFRKRLQTNENRQRVPEAGPRFFVFSSSGLDLELEEPQNELRPFGETARPPRSAGGAWATPKGLCLTPGPSRPGQHRPSTSVFFRPIGRKPLWRCKVLDLPRRPRVRLGQQDPLLDMATLQSSLPPRPRTRLLDWVSRKGKLSCRLSRSPNLHGRVAYMTEEAGQTFETVRNEQHSRNEARRIRTRVNEARQSPHSAAIRWPFELLQNALDAGPRDGRSAVTVRLRREPTKVVFEHDGAPFTLEELAALLSGGSSKEYESEITTGRFGTGFLVTHVLAERTRLCGLLQIGTGCESFELTLDRRGDEDTILENSRLASEAIHAAVKVSDPPKSSRRYLST